MAMSLEALAQEAQPLSLPDAVEMTLADNPRRRAALADTKAASAGVREARAPLLPPITCAEKQHRWQRSRVCFRSQTAATVVHCARLCAEPSASSHADGQLCQRFSGQWNLFVSTQSWKARERAKYLNFAANEQLNRRDQELV